MIDVEDTNTDKTLITRKSVSSPSPLEKNKSDELDIFKTNKEDSEKIR